MNEKELFKYEIADYFISKLKEKGRGIRLSDLESWSEKQLIDKMPENDERLFFFYTKSARDVLVDLGLARIEGNVIDLTLNGRQSAEKYPVRELVEKKLEEKHFVEKKPYREYYLSILQLFTVLLGIIIPLFFNLGDIGLSIGWLFVGIGFGFLVSEFIYMRLWKN
jgi:hypothetical protein